MRNKGLEWCCLALLRSPGPVQRCHRCTLGHSAPDRELVAQTICTGSSAGPRGATSGQPSGCLFPQRRRASKDLAGELSHRVGLPVSRLSPVDICQEAIAQGIVAQSVAPALVKHRCPESAKWFGNYLGRRNSTPRSSFSLVVALMSSEESGTFVARRSFRIQSVEPTMA